jgi:hypothetical protein
MALGCLSSSSSPEHEHNGSMPLPAPLIERLAHCATLPWPPETSPLHRTLPGHSSFIRGLRAELPCGQPLPAGVLLDAPAVSVRFPTLAQRLGVLAPVGYHPRFGLFVANDIGKCERIPIRRPTATWCAHDVAFESPVPFARDWSDLLAALLAVEDVLHSDFVLWVQTGTGDAATALWSPGEGAWSDLAWAKSAERHERTRRVLDRLDVKPLAPSGAHAGYGALVHDFGIELLIGCSTEGVLQRALEVASEENLLVLPHAWGGDRPYSAQGPETNRPIYVLETAGGGRLTVGPRLSANDASEATTATPSAPIVWTRSAGSNVIRQRHVHPRRSLAGRPAVLDGASPRLLRYFARRGALQVDALRSVEGTREWLRALDALDWNVLERIEEEGGGILLQPGWALEPPERIGPWIMHEDQASLVPLGLAESEDDPRHASQPWPFVTTHGIPLAVIGLVYGRFENALCVDVRGSIYELDHEFASLQPLADTMLRFFEKRAFRAEQFGDGFGVAHHPAAVVPIALDPALLDELGLSRVGEASDDVSSQHVSDAAWVDRWPKHASRDARTWLYSADHAFTVDAARRIREAYPELQIQIRVGVDAVSAARRSAFDAAGIAGVQQTDWTNWGNLG